MSLAVNTKNDSPGWSAMCESSAPNWPAETPPSDWPLDWTPEVIFSTSSKNATFFAVAESWRSACRVFRSVSPTRPPLRWPRSTRIGGPADLVAQPLGELGLAGAGDAQDQDAARLGPARPAPQGAEAERLHGPEPAQAGERLGAAVHLQEAGLPQPLDLHVPDHVGVEPAVADQRQAQRVLGLHAGHAGRRVEHGGEPVAVGQLAGLGRQRAGDGLDLVAAGEVVVDQDEELLELDGDLDDGGEDDDEGAGLLAAVDPGVEGLDDLDGVEEPVEVLEDEDGGAVGGGQGAQARIAARGSAAWSGVAVSAAWPARARPRSTSQVARVQCSWRQRRAISATASSCSKEWT